MNEIRKGEIAILAVKHILRVHGIRLTPNFRREIGNAAKDIGISYEEAMQFAEEIVREVVDETFTKTKK